MRELEALPSNASQDAEELVGATLEGTLFAPEMLTWLQRAIKVGKQHEDLEVAALERQREELLESLEVLLELEPQQAGGQRFCKGSAKFNDGLLVLGTDREVPFTDNESERALRPSVIFRKVTSSLLYPY